jgi:hypothetical protein
MLSDIYSGVSANKPKTHLTLDVTSAIPATYNIASVDLKPKVPFDLDIFH